MPELREKVAVWVADGHPVQIVWEGRRYRVNDQPTRLGTGSETLWPPLITHTPEPWEGWRFQAIDDNDDVRMFEVRQVPGDTGWELLRIYT